MGVLSGFIVNKAAIDRLYARDKDPLTRIIKFDLGPAALCQIL